jgi:hypothetical protein
MSQIVEDRVLETSTTVGSGVYALDGAMVGFRPASSVCLDGDTFTYYVQAVDSGGRPSGDWETGLGTWNSNNTLTRTTIYASNNSNAAVNWASGTKHVGLSGLSNLSVKKLSTPEVVFNTTTNSITSNSGVESWVYSSDYSIVAKDSEPRDIHFSIDGTKMYVLGNSSNAIHEYILTTPWSLSGTVTFNATFSVNSQEPTPYGLYFSPDGTKMFICGTTVDSVYSYNLSTAWSISTAVYNNSYSIAAYETDPQAIWFSSDGTVMFVIGTSGDDVNQFSLSTAWNITTATYVAVLPVGSYGATNTQGMSFSGDGKKLWILGSSYGIIHEFNLSTAWSIVSGVTYSDFNSVYNLSTFVLSGISGLYVNLEAGKAYVSDYNNDRIFELNTNIPTTKLNGAKWIVAPDIHLKNDIFVKGNQRITGSIYCASNAYAGTTYVTNYYLANSSGTNNFASNLSTGTLNTLTSQTTGIWYIGGATATGLLTFGRSNAAQTVSIAYGSTLSGVTKTVNIGTNGLSGSISNINIGSAITGAVSNIAINGTANVYGNINCDDVLVAGSSIAYSDERLKTDIVRIPNALYKVNSISGYTYTRTDTLKKQTGVLAQELLKVLPEAVHGDINNGYLGVAYGNVVGLLIEAIKELHNEVNILKSKLDK